MNMKRWILLVVALLWIAPAASVASQMVVFEDMELVVTLSDESLANAQSGRILSRQEEVGDTGLAILFYYLDDLSKLENVTFTTDEEVSRYIQEIGDPICGFVRLGSTEAELPTELRGMEEETVHEEEGRIFRLYHPAQAQIDAMESAQRAVTEEFFANFADPASSIQATEIADADAPLLGNFAARDIDLQDVYTPEVFADHRLTMINVWGTFCGPCIDEMPDLAAIAEEYADRGFQIIGIVSDVSSTAEEGDEKLALARMIAEETGASNYLHLIPDTVMILTKLKDSVYVPETFFVDSEGKVVGDSVVGSKDKASWSQIIEERLAMVE